MGRNPRKINVLFLCTGNACRSQMAEGWTRHLKSDQIEPFSAGIAPAGLSQRAVEVMAEAGVDISNQRSKHIDDLPDIPFDYVVTLCDYVRQLCHTWPGPGKLIHKPFDDPSFIQGNEQQVMNAFRITRDRIRAFVETLPQSLEDSRQNEA